MTFDNQQIKKKSYFKTIPSGCDSYIFAANFPITHFIVSGPCQVVITNKKGNWFMVEVLKEKTNKVIRAPRNNKKVINEKI